MNLCVLLVQTEPKTQKDFNFSPSSKSYTYPIVDPRIQSQIKCDFFFDMKRGREEEELDDIERFFNACEKGDMTRV